MKVEVHPVAALVALSWALAACAAGSGTLCTPGSACERGERLIDRGLPPPGFPIEPTFMGDRQRTGRSPYRGPQHTPVVRFRIETDGRIRAAPVIDANGHVIVASQDGTVRAFTPIGAPVFQVSVEAPVSATPVIAGDGALWVGTESGLLWVLEPDGSVRGRLALGAPIRGPLAVTADGTILVAADGMHGFRANLSRRFHHPTADDLLSGPAVHADGLIVFGTLHGRLRAIDLDGALRWERHAGSAIEATPTIADDGTIVVGNLLGDVIGVTAAGKERFRFQPEGEDSIFASAALTRSGGFALGRADGSVYLLDGSGQPLDTLPTSGSIHASARVDSAGTIFVGSRDDSFYAFSDDGIERWRYNLGQDIDAPAAIGPDGTLYVGTDHGALYALHEPP